MPVTERCPACGSMCEAQRDDGKLMDCRSCGVAFVSGGATAVALWTVGTDGREQAHGDLELPQSFLARYRPDLLLGRGGMGTVYRAQDLETGRQVAVKFLTRILDQTGLDRFLREGRLMTRIVDPCVVQVFDVQEIVGCPYLVCEYVEGGTLRDHLASRGRLPPVEAIAIALDVLAGLSACHARGIVHRDLKPENVLLTGTGRAKLADLGIAKDYGSTDTGMTAVGQIIGTPRYMAPEQVRGEPAVVASDLYAAGLILYEMLAGRMPYDTDQFVAMLHAVQYQEPVPLATLVPDIPPALATLVSRTLVKPIADRPASAHDLAGALSRVLRAPEKPRKQPASMPASAPDSPAGLRMACALLLGLVLAGAVLHVSRRHFEFVEEPLFSLANLPADAEERSRAVVARHPTDSRAHFRHGRILWKLKKLPAAEAAFREAVRLDPKFVSAIVHLGIVAQERQTPADAEAEFRRALELDPHSAEALRSLARLQLDQRRYVEAEATFAAAAAETPADPNLHSGLAEARSARKDWSGAADSLANAVRLAPASQPMHEAYLRALERAGRYPALHRERLRFRAPGTTP